MGVWQELLFGEGFWFGLILIESMLFIVSSAVKHFNYIASAISMCMFIVYYQELATNEFSVWGMLIMGISTVFFLLLYKD